jgi:fatty-acid desaturase
MSQESSQTSYLGPVTDRLINLLVTEVKKKQNKEKIMKYVINPILCDISKRYYSYVIMSIIVLILVILLLISILVLTVVKK